jgi:hypothetical protein
MKKSIVVAMLAILVIGSFAFFPTFAQADETKNQSLWIRMRGHIQEWGTEPAFGWINTHVRMIDVNGTYREWAWIHATWSTDVPHINCSEPPTENFTFVHYAARLINTTDITLNGTDYDLLVTGLWNVTKITVSVYVDEDGNLLYVERVVEPYLADLATGEFKVFNGWRRFELNITGVPLLTGMIVGYRMAFMEIKLFDLNDDGKVDIVDLVRVARRYRFVPGVFNYDDSADVNADGQVDIGDLTTVAANIEG